MSNQQHTFAEGACSCNAPSCGQGHDWQPTIIIGYFQCTRCSKLAACKFCVSKVRGKAVIGYCQAHQHMRAPEMEQEVLG
jgi:hypothetical protein